MNYKAETTLCERDALNDILFTLRYLTQTYSNANTHATSKGFLKISKEHEREVASDRLKTFMLLAEKDYARVTACSDERQLELIERFKKRINNLN